MSRYAIVTVISVVLIYAVGVFLMKNSEAVDLTVNGIALKANTPTENSNDTDPYAEAQKISSVPGLDSFQLEYDVEITYYITLNPKAPYQFSGLSPEETQDWLNKQQSPRTQTLKMIQTKTPNGWGYETICEAGPVYPVKNDQREFFNFTDQVHTIQINGRKTEREFNEITASLIGMSLNSYRTPSVLLGVFDNISIFDGGHEYEIKTARAGDEITKQYYRIQPKFLLLEATFSDDKLTMLKYYEDIALVRVLEYKEYQMNDSLGIDLPQQVSLKIYSGATIGNLHEEKLQEAYVYNLKSAKLGI